MTLRKCKNIRFMTLVIYIGSLRAQHVRSDKVFVIAGCNASLEWILGNSKTEIDVMSITVFNNRGIRIAQMEDTNCEVTNSAVHCEIMHREKQYVLSLSLFNITQANSENFTVLIRSITSGERNVTKQLIVIAKPIVKSPKPTLHRPMNLSCTVAGNLVEAKYRWKLNVSYLNCTGRICARSSVLTIENLTMEDKLNMFSCEVCTECSCCAESEAYTPDPYYVTVFPSPPREKQGLRVEKYWMGPVIVCVFLLIVSFVIFATGWRKTTRRGIGRRPIQLCVKANIANDDPNRDTGTQSQDLIKSRHENRVPKLQEDMYTTIDEPALSVYDYARNNVIERNSNETGSSTGHGYYKYTTSMAMCPTGKTDVHVPDEYYEDYITPLCDLTRPIDICKNGESNKPGTDQTYITPRNEFVCPIKRHVCQVEKTDVLETEHSYITPIV